VKTLNLLRFFPSHKEIYMPIYEYKCPNCNDIFELKRNIKDIPKEFPCPKCGNTARKIYPKYSFQFSLYLQELGGDNMIDY